MRTCSYSGADRRAAPRTLSQAASVMLRLSHDIAATTGDCQGLRDMAICRYMMASRLIAGKYDEKWEAMTLLT